MNNKTYKNKFTFGKVAYTGKSKAYLVELEMTLKIEDNLPIFSASGTVWNTSHTDCVMGGQCIDSIYSDFKREILNRKKYEAIMGLWERNHLNDMNAGCEHQRAEKWEDKLIDPSKPKTQDNMRIWKYKKEGGLLAVACKKCGYKYGTSWKYRPISKEDLREICQLLEMDFRDRIQIAKS